MKFFTAFVAGASGTILEILENFFIWNCLENIFNKKSLATVVHTQEDCPTTKCWEIVDNKCSLKTSCNTLLTCTPDNVDFRPGSEKLYRVKFFSEKYSKAVLWKSNSTIFCFWISYKDIIMLTFSALKILMTKFPRHVTIVPQPTSQGRTAATNNGSLLSDPATLPAKKQLIIDWKLQKNSNMLLNHTPEMTLATLYFLLKLKILSKLKSLVFSIRLSQQLLIRSNWETKLWLTKVNLMLRAAGRTLSQFTTC